MFGNKNNAAVAEPVSGIDAVIFNEVTGRIDGVLANSERRASDAMRFVAGDWQHGGRVYECNYLLEILEQNGPNDRQREIINGLRLRVARVSVYTGQVVGNIDAVAVLELFSGRVEQPVRGWILTELRKRQPQDPGSQGIDRAQQLREMRAAEAELRRLEAEEQAISGRTAQMAQLRSEIARLRGRGLAREDST